MLNGHIVWVAITLLCKNQLSLFLKGNVFCPECGFILSLFSARLIDVYWTESKALEFRVWLCLIWINIYLNFKFYFTQIHFCFQNALANGTGTGTLKEQGLNTFFFFFWGGGGRQELSNLLTHYFSLSCSYSFIHLGMYT